MVRRFLLCFFICVAFCVASCGCNGVERGYFAYRNTDFRAEIRGTIAGMDFCAEVGREAGKNGAETYVRYLAPASLEGLCLRLGADSRVRVSAVGLSGTLVPDAADGLLLPLTLLLDYPNDVREVRKSDGRLTLCLPDEVELTLDESWLPVSVRSPRACFTVVWWEVISE